MAKKPTQNKIGESFEQNLPDELLPDFIWDNISNALDTNKVPTESTEKIKASFEEGFDEAIVPPLLWTGIESSLDQASIPSSMEQTNKIKTSFEAGHQDILPENLWENVENQLEIEGVWKRVLKGLNRRTKRQYWQEKGMQFSLVALALLLLRGCDFGEWLPIPPIANESTNILAKTDLDGTESTPVSVTNSNVKSTNLVASDATNLKPINTNSSLKNTLLEETYTFPTIPVFSRFQKTLLKTNLESKSPLLAKNTKTFMFTKKESKQEHSDNEESLSVAELKENRIPNTSSKVERRTDKVIVPSSSNTSLVNKGENVSNKIDSNPSGVLATKVITNNTIDDSKIDQNALASKTAASSKNEINVAVNNPVNKTNTLASRTFLSEKPISTLTGESFVDPAVETIYTFEIDNVVNKKKHNIRFELGMNGKIGTSLLLGNATNKAMETTSMVKTKMRAAGSVGIMFDCYLTANDAIVFGAYPLSNSQQYFGGYTNEGRYYHKEVKLAYFDFTLGYQRTLFHYNDFGTVPSSMYARLDYGLGYLSKSEEIVNGLAAELGDSYSKLNHSIGLTVGNTHRINRFVIDYGIYGNIGLSSVQNMVPSGTNSVEYNNLATMGGYLGLRYVL